jgi:hypothetical protein
MLCRQLKKSTVAQPTVQRRSGTRKCATQAQGPLATKRKPSRIAAAGLEPGGKAWDQEARGCGFHAAAACSTALAAATSSNGRPPGCHGHCPSITRTQFKSGRICSQMNRPSVSRSNAAQRAGGIPRFRHSMTDGGLHPARRATSPGPSSVMMSMARSLRHCLKSAQGIASFFRH